MAHILLDPDRTTVRTLFIRDEVATAADAAAEMLIDELGLDERGEALVNLLVNAALTLLDTPSATLDDVVAANYKGEDTETVLSWLD